MNGNASRSSLTVHCLQFTVHDHTERLNAIGRRVLLREKTKWAEKMGAFLRPDARFSEKILSLFERRSRRLLENEVFLRDGFETGSRELLDRFERASRIVREGF